MKNISVELSVDGINSLIKQLKEYSESLDAKNERFVELLLDCGIRVAEQKLADGTHTMPSRISFYKGCEIPDNHTIKGIMVGVGETFFSHWYEVDGTEHYDEVFPLAMMEFGSGGFAVPPTNAFGGYGGQGTFSVSGHENDYEWRIITAVDSKGNPTEWKRGTAIKPTQPMYNAMLEMQTQIRDCAIQAFGGE